jgi:hypothetical protein
MASQWSALTVSTVFLAHRPNAVRPAEDQTDSYARDFNNHCWLSSCKFATQSLRFFHGMTWQVLTRA